MLINAVVTTKSKTASIKVEFDMLNITFFCNDIFYVFNRLMYRSIVINSLFFDNHFVSRFKV